MKNRNRMLLMVVLVFAVILNMATGVLATEQEHDHNWVYQGGGGKRGHSVTCDGCGQTKLVDHTVDSSGNCTVCSYHIHIWQREWYADGFHGLVCSGCQEKKTETHSKDSAGVCTVCGYTPHEHTWQYNGEKYAYTHGLRCTQCAGVGKEDHIYGNDGNCIVCGNAPPHEHQWEWDGNKSNSLSDHYKVCSCGERTSESHRLFAWDGQMGDRYGHSELCGVCGFALIFKHVYDPAFYNGERCTVCWYLGQGTTEPGKKPSETAPVETRPAEAAPKETAPVETAPAETALQETAPVETAPAETVPKDTTPVETETAETQAKETECTESESTQSEPPSSETTNQNSEEKDSRHSSSIWVWVAVILAAVGGLGAVLLFLKKKFY